MPFTYTEEREQVVMPEMGKQCPFQTARFCHRYECELWLDGECAFVKMARALNALVLFAK